MAGLGEAGSCAPTPAFHMQLSTDKILLAAKSMLLRKHKRFPAKHLDIGSGTGALIALLQHEGGFESVGCDYTADLIEVPNVRVDIANLNFQNLPYEAESFDAVTCTEVVEHLENHRHAAREIFRVLKCEGTAVISTPNILNLKSRLRFLWYGFYNLFGPLHFKESALYSTGGHITPISLFYLVHSLVDAGFTEIEVTVDKHQSTSMFLLMLLYAPIVLISKIIHAKEASKYQTVDAANAEWVRKMNSTDILLGRTLIVGARKPGPAL